MPSQATEKNLPGTYAYGELSNELFQEDKKASSSLDSFVRSYLKGLKVLFLPIVLFWTALGVYGFFWGMPGLLSNTFFSLKAPKGTESFLANQKRAESFPEGSGLPSQSTSIMLLVQRAADAPHHESILNNATKLCNNKTSDLVYAYKASYAPGSVERLPAKAVSFISYYTYVQKSPDLKDVLKEQFVSPNEDAMYFLVSINTTAMSAADEQYVQSDFVEYVTNTVITNDVCAKASLKVDATGIPIFAVDMHNGIDDNIKQTEMFAFPAAMILLAYCIASVRLLLLPIVAIGFTMTTAFSIMYPISLVMNVTSIAPSLMSSVALALSVDYSLFVLARYREEVLKLNHRKGPILLLKRIHL